MSVKKTNMDLVVGASILIALVILIGGVLWLKEALVSQKMVSYTMLFPKVGSLQVGDPVMANGVTKGRVADIYLRNDEVAVAVNLEKDVPLSDSCLAKVSNIGLMGERGIDIDLNRKGTRCKPTSKKDTTFLNGNFDTGIAEAMGMIGVVLSQVQVVIVNVSTIMSSTVGDTAFLNMFHTLVNRLDTLSFVAERLVVKNGPVVDQSLKNLNAATAQLKELLDKNSGHLSAIMANGEALSAYSLTLAARVDSLTGSIQGIVNEVQNGQGALGMMLKDKEFPKDIKRTIADIQILVNDVQKDALKLRVVSILGIGKKKK
jgi:phospholipid/cholesterol/gamma-HCH transport system substrate-binding protein